MEIKNIPSPNIPDWLKLYNTYDPTHYTPGKRVSAEEWNTLFLGAVNQGNYNADTLELLIKTYLPSKFAAYTSSLQQLTDTVNTSNNIAIQALKTASAVKDIVDTADLNAITAKVFATEAKDIAQDALTIAAQKTGTALYTEGNLLGTFNIDIKADVDYVDRQVAALVGAAPETLDTLEELATALKENENVASALDAAISNKADKVSLNNYYTKPEMDNILSNFEPDSTSVSLIWWED